MARWFWTVALLVLLILVGALTVAWLGDVMARWGTP